MGISARITAAQGPARGDRAARKENKQQQTLASSATTTASHIDRCGTQRRHRNARTTIMSMSRLLQLARMALIVFAMVSVPIFDVASAEEVPRKEWCMWDTSPWYGQYESCKYFHLNPGHDDDGNWTPEDWNNPELHECFIQNYKTERKNFPPVDYAIKACKKITKLEAKQDDDIKDNKVRHESDCLRRTVYNGPCFQEWTFLHENSDDIPGEILNAKVKMNTGSKRCEKAKRAWKRCKKDAEDGDDAFSCFYKEYKDDNVYGRMSDLCLESFPGKGKKDKKFMCFLLAVAKGACVDDDGFLKSKNL